MTVETAHNGRPLLRDTDGGLKMCEIRMTGGWGRTILVMTLADVPSNYRGQQGLEALRNLPVAWDETHCLGGEIGSWYVVERKSPDGRRYLAVITAGARHRRHGGRVRSTTIRLKNRKEEVYDNRKRTPWKAVCGKMESSRLCCGTRSHSVCGQCRWLPVHRLRLSGGERVVSSGFIRHVARRFGFGAGDRSYLIGFRVVCTAGLR